MVSYHRVRVCSSQNLEWCPTGTTNCPNDREIIIRPYVEGSFGDTSDGTEQYRPDKSAFATDVWHSPLKHGMTTLTFSYKGSVSPSFSSPYKYGRLGCILDIQVS